MITGILGFRSNEWQEKNGRYVLVSPSHQDFIWKEPLVWAQCLRCPKDDDGHVIIQPHCSCGIYATLHEGTVKAYIMYPTTVTFLVEAMGDAVVGNDQNAEGDQWAGGFRAPGVLAVYIIDVYMDEGTAFRKLGRRHEMNPHSLAITAVAQQWHMQVITWKDAMGMAQIMWRKNGQVWHGRDWLL